MTRLTFDSELEEQFFHEWVRSYPQLPPSIQYRFHPKRKFRFDFAWPDNKLAVEINGFGEGHFTILSITKDYDRHIEATLLDWKVVYLTTLHLQGARAIETYEQIATLLGQPKSQYISLAERRKKWIDSPPTGTPGRPRKN